jgi:Lon protease-like protein
MAIDTTRPIPLFPLGGVALMPHATAPLHIFEKRYRDMTADALQGDRLIAMSTYAWLDAPARPVGDPPLMPHVCIGQIVRADQLPDGRFNILLHGLARAAVEEEPQVTTRYRQAYLDLIEDRSVMEIDLSDERSTIDRLINDPLLQRLAGMSPLRNLATGELPTAALVDLTTMCICDDAKARYAMLAEADVSRRAGWLRQHLEQTRRTIAVADRFGPAVDENGVHMN